MSTVSCSQGGAEQLTVPELSQCQSQSTLTAGPYTPRITDCIVRGYLREICSEDLWLGKEYIRFV